MIGGANGKEAYSDLHIFYPHNFTWKTIMDVRVGSPLSSIHRLTPYLLRENLHRQEVVIVH